MQQVYEKQFGLYFPSFFFFAKEKHLRFCYRIVLSLQRMLTLAVEVDKDPTYNSDKLSEELFSCLNRMCSCRKKRWTKNKYRESILQLEVALFYILNDQSFIECWVFILDFYCWVLWRASCWDASCWSCCWMRLVLRRHACPCL